MELQTRTLAWERCANVRDLGGLPTAGGGRTRYGALVRGDSRRRLTAAGWEALLAHGVRTAIDLRWREEVAADPPFEVPIEVVHVPLFGDHDPQLDAALSVRFAGLGAAERIRETYLHFLSAGGDAMARAVRAVAAAREGGVLVHCTAGKDRTGLVAAFLLRLAGVAPDDVADDYAESAANVEHLTRLWIDEASDAEEREHREHLSSTPREAMLDVLAAVEERWGGVRGYLLAAGATDAELERAAGRLL